MSESKETKNPAGARLTITDIQDDDLTLTFTRTQREDLPEGTVELVLTTYAEDRYVFFLAEEDVRLLAESISIAVGAVLDG